HRRDRNSWVREASTGSRSEASRSFEGGSCYDVNVRSNQSRPPGKKSEDVVWVHGPSDDGEALHVLRKRGDEVSFGQMRRAEEGKPFHGELVALKPREDVPRLFDVEVLHESHAARADGPANVSSEAYRRGWASVFGAKKRAGSHLN